MTEKNTDNEDSALSTLEARIAELERLLGELDSDTRLAIEKLIYWMAERPKGAESLGKEKIEQMVEEIRLENIRRRLGGIVGEILPFKKPETNK